MKMTTILDLCSSFQAVKIQTAFDSDIQTRHVPNLQQMTGHVYREGKKIWTTKSMMMFVTCGVRYVTNIRGLSISLRTKINFIQTGITVKHSLQLPKQWNKYSWGACIFCIAGSFLMMFVTVSCLLRTSSHFAMPLKILHTVTEGLYIFLICTTYCGLLNNNPKLMHESHACDIRVTLVVVSTENPRIVSCYEHHPFWNTVEKFI